MLAPLIPPPTITMSASLGRRAVVRRPEMASGGSCQYEAVGWGRGRPAGMEALCSILARLKAQTGVVSATTWLVEFQDCDQRRAQACHGFCVARIHAMHSSKELTVGACPMRLFVLGNDNRGAGARVGCR